jgi:hypothetical protein
VISSHPQSRAGVSGRSTEDSNQRFAAIRQLSLDLEPKSVVPGSFNDCFVIRAILVDAIKHCGKSRAQLAEEMTFLSGRKITERMLYGFTAESKEDSRWPGELDRAFCKATGDNRLLGCRVEQAGLHVVTDVDMELRELGKQFLIRKEADEQIALLERRLHGRAL